jgi:hypothetical protein
MAAWTVYDDANWVVTWGYAATPGGGTARAWMVRNPEGNPRALVRAGRLAVDYMLSLYPRVVVLNDPEVEKSPRWLEWLGFRPTSQPLVFLAERR